VGQSLLVHWLRGSMGCATSSNTESEYGAFHQARVTHRKRSKTTSRDQSVRVSYALFASKKERNQFSFTDFVRCS
jgi:hypothetical protein